MCRNRGCMMSTQNQKPPEENLNQASVPTTGTTTTPTRVSSSPFQQQPHVNLERMPISIVPKLARPGSQAPSSQSQSPQASGASKEKANNTNSLVSALASQPPPQIVIPKLPHQAQHQHKNEASHLSEHVVDTVAPTSSTQSEEAPLDFPVGLPPPSTDPDVSNSPHPQTPLTSPKHVPFQSPSHSHSQVSSPRDPSKLTTPIVRIKGITTGQPVLVESPPFGDSFNASTSAPVAGAKKRRGERGPDKNPNIDPRTGKRRYIKRKNKHLGTGFDLGDLDYMKKKERKKFIRKYLPGGDHSIPRIHTKGIRKHRKYHDDRHNRHQRHSSHKYSSDYYITPWSRTEESDAESLVSSQEDESERLDPMYSVWRPTDDLRLIMNVLQTNDLREVLLGTKFSSYYSLEEIEARWDYLVFDESMCKVSQNAIRNLPGRLKHDICSKALFSAKENALLQEIPSSSDSKQLIPVMKKLLNENPLVFLKWRTPQQLTRQWMHLRDFHLLCDQDVRHYFEQHNFEDFEGTVNDCDIYPPPYVDDAVLQEKLIQRRLTRKRIRRLERELFHWQIAAEKSIPGIPPVFEKDAYAMLRGKNVRYFMRDKEITFGRRTESNDDDRNVDADLALEGSMYKISRKQGIISLRENGEFVILNQGKHTIYVDGQPLYPNTLGALRDHSVIEVSLLSFVFLFNHELLRQEAERIRMEKARMESMLFGSLPRSLFSPSSFYLPHYLPSSSSSSSSILTSSFSNTLPLALPPLVGHKKLLTPNNSHSHNPLPLSSISSDKTNMGLGLGIPNLHQHQVLKPGGMTSPTPITIPALRGSQLSNNNSSGMLTRPWYLEPSRSEPPPLTSRISSPILNSIQLGPDSHSNLMRSLSLPVPLSFSYSSFPSVSQTSPNPSPIKSSFSSSATMTTTSTFASSLTYTTGGGLNEITASPLLRDRETDAELLDSTTLNSSFENSNSNSIQFGDLTIRPGIPPPSETTSFNS